MSNPQNPQYIASVSVGGWVDDLIVVDSLAYLCGYPFGGTKPPQLSIINVAQPGLPQVLSQVSVLPELPPPLGGLQPTSLTLSGDYVFVTHNWGVSIIDVSNKLKPQLVNWITTPRVPRDIAISGNFACLANGAVGLRIYDVSDPLNPVEKTITPDFAVGITTRNDIVFVATAGLVLFKISPSGNLLKLGEVATPGSRTTVDIALQEHFAYLAYNEDLVVVDISDLRLPVVVDHTITPAYADGVAFKSNHIFVAGGVWALQIYRNNLVTQVDEKRFDRLPVSPRLYLGYPNPFNTMSIIEYEIPKAGSVELKVFNSLGKEIAELSNDWQNSGRYRIFFDAKNLPSGVYFCRLRFNNWQASQKMLIVR